jgi:sugar O-acyltransferase (sialic acid O-acetyltransferase NeuD family)
MKKVVIFGLGDNAELAKYYFDNDSDYKVVAFTVDKQYTTEKMFHKLPIIPFDKVEQYYSPDEVDLFIAVGYTNMNEVRELKYLDGKKRGYKFVNYISSKATILTDKIGENNFILEDNTIQPYVEIGNNNVFWSGNHIGHHGRIGNNCFITSHVVISGRCIIEDNCFMGVNSTIRDHIKIRYKSLIGAGAWISEDTEEYGVYLSNIATKIKKKSIELKISD